MGRPRPCKPPPRLFLVLLSLLIASFAWGGHCEIGSVSGGKAYTSLPTPHEYDYVQFWSLGFDYGAEYNICYGGSGNTGTGGTSKCSGEVTYVLKWHADAGEPAPAKVIVGEFAYALAIIDWTSQDENTGVYAYDGTIQASTGLGAANEAVWEGVGSGVHSDNRDKYREVWGSKYEVADGGDTVTVKLSPFATAVSNAPADTIRCYAETAALTSVSVYPLQIKLSGSVYHPEPGSGYDKSQTAVGCRVTATLDTGYYDYYAPNPHFTWQIGTECKPFDHYVFDPDASHTQDTATLVPWNPADQSGTSGVFAKAGPTKIKCRYQDARGIDVTLEVELQVQSPNFKVGFLDDTIGTWKLDSSNPATASELILSPTARQSDGKSLTQRATEAPVIALLGAGKSKVQNLQLINFDCEKVKLNGAADPLTFPPDDFVQHQLGLDGRVPSWEVKEVGARGGLVFRDSPVASLFSYKSVRWKATEVYIYLMYRPDTPGAEWVPLAREAWTFDGRASLNATQTAWSITLNGRTHDGMIAYYDHPVWTVNVHNLPPFP